jgi:hypothetical protein
MKISPSSPKVTSVDSSLPSDLRTVKSIVYSHSSSPGRTYFVLSEMTVMNFESVSGNSKTYSVGKSGTLTAEQGLVISIYPSILDSAPPTAVASMTYSYTPGSAVSRTRVKLSSSVEKENASNSYLRMMD